MPPFLSVHAVRRMAERRITRDEVVEALNSRDTTYPSEDDPDNALVVLGKTAAGRPLKVVVEAADQEAVITVAVRGEEA